MKISIFLTFVLILFSTLSCSTSTTKDKPIQSRGPANSKEVRDCKKDFRSLMRFPLPKKLVIKLRKQVMLWLEQSAQRVAKNEFEKTFTDSNGIEFELGEKLGGGFFGVVYKVKITNFYRDHIREFPHLFRDGKSREDLVIKFPNQLPIKFLWNSWLEEEAEELESLKKLLRLPSYTGAEYYYYNKSNSPPFILKKQLEGKTVKDLGKEMDQLDKKKVQALKEIYLRAEIAGKLYGIYLDLKPSNFVWSDQDARFYMYEVDTTSYHGYVSNGFDDYLQLFNSFLN